jgi:hypothetical protein
LVEAVTSPLLVLSTQSVVAGQEAASTWNLVGSAAGAQATGIAVGLSEATTTPALAPTQSAVPAQATPRIGLGPPGWAEMLHAGDPPPGSVVLTRSPAVSPATQNAPPQQ